MASLRGFRCVGIALIAVLSCLSAGCSEDTRVQVEDPSVFACQEAKMFVKALDYIVNNSKAERTKEAYETLGTILHDDSRKDEFGPHADALGSLATLSGEVKVVLEQTPPKFEDARPKVDEMIELADDLPGGEAYLQEVWDIQQ